MRCAVKPRPIGPRAGGADGITWGERMTRNRSGAARQSGTALRLLAVLLLPCAVSARAQERPAAGHGAESFFPTPVTVPKTVPVPVQPGQRAAADMVPRLRLDVLEKGNSSRDEMQAAVRRVPYAEFTPAVRERLRPVLQSPTLFRRLPKIRCEVDSRAYSFFTTHPDVAVSIWRAMGISDMQMRQTGPFEYETDLTDGTQGVVTVLYRSAETHVVMCEGQFKSPLLAKPIHSVGLMSLQAEFTRDAAGRGFVTHSADVFVLFPSNAVEAVARLISPMSFKMADRNFEEVSLFLRMMDEAMSRQPEWVEQISPRLDGVLPGRDGELLDVMTQVYADAQQRQPQAISPVSPTALGPASPLR